MVSEDIIDKVLEQFDTQAIDYEETVRRFASDQPALFAYLIGDNEGVFSQDEEDFLLYLALVIFKSVETANPDGLPVVDEEEISSADEANWELMESSKATDFHKRLDAFYEKSPQEDLMAFVEDSLVAEAENEEGEPFTLTAEGREPMFVALKTVIDVLTQE
ncbi:MAG: hypothetical protein MUC59_17390 [Saprospiraceae bacterium]|jgi:hypothetical protein|nr:hypothetical protein [Saprospiraceae bacterium]